MKRVDRKGDGRGKRLREGGDMRVKRGQRR